MSLLSDRLDLLRIKLSRRPVVPIRQAKLMLGNVRRDWGSAPEYVEATWQILQSCVSDHFVTAASMVSSLEDFVSAAFEPLDLD